MESITEVKHSESKKAWNVIGSSIAKSEVYKYARCPYMDAGNEIIDTRNKAAALARAEFISSCFNHKEEINKLKLRKWKL